VNELYRDNATIGSGSSADAVRHELSTGEPVGEKFHTQKVKDKLRELKKWQKSNTTSASTHDRRVVENLIEDMENALNGE